MENRKISLQEFIKGVCDSKALAMPLIPAYMAKQENVWQAVYNLNCIEIFKLSDFDSRSGKVKAGRPSSFTIWGTAPR